MNVTLCYLISQIWETLDISLFYKYLRVYFRNVFRVFKIITLQRIYNIINPKRIPWKWSMSWHQVSIDWMKLRNLPGAIFWVFILKGEEYTFQKLLYDPKWLSSYLCSGFSEKYPRKLKGYHIGMPSMALFWYEIGIASEGWHSNSWKVKMI